jgi:CheY-like chemotaxis protein
VTKILVVDDEPALSRGLSRAILLRRPDYSVLTAGSGREAIALLEEQHIDLVISDLQMAEMDGFALLAWLLSQRAHVLSFAMTAYASDETQARLQALGGVECFSKPLDVDALVARLADGLSQNIRGHVHNVGLASFLQLVELERKTCTLEVRSEGQVGQLFVRKGELLDAQTDSLGGEAAALAILGWLNVSIRIDSACQVAQRSIDKPCYHVVMEAMRVRDESVRPAPGKSDRPPLLPGSGPPLSADLFAAFASEPPRREPAPFCSPPSQVLATLHAPTGALGLAVVDAQTGAAAMVRDRLDLCLAERIEMALAIVRQERATLALSVGANAVLEELVMLAQLQGELIRPLPQRDAFVFMIFDAAATNLVMARLELDLFVAEYCAAA